MREVVFHVVAEHSGHLEAQAEFLPIHISAPTLEELQHEAREALIEHFGPAHGAVRVRVRRRPGAAVRRWPTAIWSGASSLKGRAATSTCHAIPAKTERSSPPGDGLSP